MRQALKDNDITRFSSGIQTSLFPNAESRIRAPFFLYSVGFKLFYATNIFVRRVWPLEAFFYVHWFKKPCAMWSIIVSHFVRNFPSHRFEALKTVANCSGLPLENVAVECLHFRNSISRYADIWRNANGR